MIAFNIAAKFKKMKIGSGELIYKENDPVDYFFVIADGN